MGGYIQQTSSLNSIVEAVARHAVNEPEHLALRIGKESYSYGDLWKRILSSVVKLRHLGKGTIVILSTDKSIDYISHYFAAHLQGLICILADTKLTSEAIQKLISSYSVKAFITNKGEAQGVTVIRYKDTCAEDAAFHPVFPERTEIADYMFTTGTTGESKCVPLTHGNLLASARNINAFIGNSQDDHELIALPLCHSFGMGRVRCALLAGGACTIIPNFANERKLLSLMESKEITGFSMVPAAWQYLRHLCETRFISAARNLRFIEIGSAPLPVEDKRFLATNLPDTRICMHYGLTEASRSAFMEFHTDGDKLSGCGKPTPGVEIAIFSSEGKQLGPNESGEICVRGEHVTQGYLNLSKEDCFYGDFFRTGDIGMLDSDNTLFIQGRLKEQINVGGKKVSPDEIELKLRLFPGVKECACTGAADPDGILGEVVKAHIVPDDNVDINTAEVIQFMKTQVQPHAVPRIVEVRKEPLPRTESGKLQRQKLQ